MRRAWYASSSVEPSGGPDARSSSIAARSSPRNAPPPAGNTGPDTWYARTATAARCPQADPVVSLDLPARRYFAADDPAFNRSPAFACTSEARSHGLTAAVVYVPIEAKQSDSSDAYGGAMETKLTISPTGALVATTDTHQLNMLHGFHGMVYVVLADGSSSTLWKSEAHPFNVGVGTMAPSRRSD